MAVKRIGVGHHQFSKGWVTIGASKLAFRGNLHAHAEEEYFNFDGQRCSAGTLSSCALIGQFQVEFNRDVDDTEHAQETPHSEITCQGCVKVARAGIFFHLEVDACHGVDAAAGNANIQRQVGSKFKGSFKAL